MISEYDSSNKGMNRLEGEEKLEAEKPIRKQLQLSRKMMFYQIVLFLKYCTNHPALFYSSYFSG